MDRPRDFTIVSLVRCRHEEPCNVVVRKEITLIEMARELRYHSHVLSSIILDARIVCSMESFLPSASVKYRID